MGISKALESYRELHITRTDNVLDLKILEMVATIRESEEKNITMREHQNSQATKYLKFCWKTKLLNNASILQKEKYHEYIVIFLENPVHKYLSNNAFDKIDNGSINIRFTVLRYLPCCKF